MNHPKANRLRLSLAIAIVAAFAAVLPATAGAAISSTVDARFGDTKQGAHSDYSNLQTFDYSANTLPYSDNEDLRKWIIDSPAGQIGNPNDIPYATRCTEAQFTTVIDPGNDNTPPYFNACPPGSKVGIAGVVLARDDTGAEIDGNGAVPSWAAFSALGFGTEFAYTGGLFGGLDNATPGTIYLLQTDPEIPVTLGTFFHLSSVPGVGPAGAAVTRSDLAPVTSGPDGDFRIRVIPQDDTPHRTVTVAPGPPPVILPLHIKKIMQHLNGSVDPDAASINQPTVDRTTPWLTNPTRCSDWDSYSYATEYGTNSNADSAPVDGDGTVYKKSAPSTTTPDCSTPPGFGANLSASVSGGARDSNPSLTVTVTNPYTPGVDMPKSVVTTLPATLTTDLQKIKPENICSIADRDAGTCQAGAKVGSVHIDTPFISAGLTGTVYITKGDNPALPNLAMYITGAINFRLDVTNKFVGANGNQIQSTLDNLPQTLFTKFDLTIDGGQDSLLTIPPCLTNGNAPEDGPITSTMVGYTGAVVNSSSEIKYNGCFSTPKIKSPRKCVKKRLKVTPSNILNRPGVSKVDLLYGSKKAKRPNKRLSTDRAYPYKFNSKLSKKKFKKGRTYRFRVKVTYKPTTDFPAGKVNYSKTGKFKVCK